MAAIDLGRLRFFHQGVYSGATTYEVNDVVSYGGKSYVYINTTNAAGNLPTNATYWSLMADGQDFRGTWATSTAYKVDDIVVRGGVSYICLEEHTSGTFSVNLAANKWQAFVSGTNWRGDWAETTAYLLNDIVFINGNAYIATTDHTSTSTFATDLAEPYWALFSQGGTGEIPSQTDNANKVLTTDGTDVSWTNTLSIANATVSGALLATSVTSNTSVIALTVEANTAATVGVNSATFSNTLTNPTLTIQSNAADYSQVAFRNLGTDANSSTDFIAYADLGDDDSGWIDMGITSSNFSDESFTITSDHDGYIFMEAPANTTGNGNLVLATGGNGAQNKIIFAAGGLSSNDTQMVITPNTSVSVNIATNSVSATTGALVVAGGLGVGGNVYINGNTNIVGTITVGGGAFESNNLTVSDPIVFMGNTNTGDTFDLGFAGKFDDGSVKYAGLLRDASDGKFKLFTGLTVAPTSTANFAASSNASLVVANLEASGNAAVTGNVTVTTDLTVTGNTTASTNLTVTGNATVSTDLTVTGNTTLTGGLTVSGALTAAEMSEIATSGTITTNVLTLDWTTTNITYVSSPAANFTLNVTNAPTTNDRALAVTVLVTQGGTGYIPSALQIAGSAQTIKWSGGSAPAGTANKIDIFSFVLLRTGSAWTVFGSSSLNF
jgi:cytoskeletal protein CcmA (bactofilin family)